jgi:hypothetical protein
MVNFIYEITTDQIGVAVMLYDCIRRVTGSNLGGGIGYSDY